MNEVEIAALLCGLLGGADAETAKKFENTGIERRVRVDCETPTHVIEVGLDGKSSSRDSVHQAVFAAVLSGKIPMVVIIDRDGVEDRYEQEMRIVTERLNIAFHVCSANFIVRWVNASPWRTAKFNDLPDKSIAEVHCDLDLAIPQKELN